MSDPNPAAAADDPFPLGRVPFRIRIGITGHRSLREHDRLVEAVDRAVERIATALLPVSAVTPVKLAAVSSLADGGDRIGVRAVRRHARGDARVEVVLPLRGDDYARVQGFDVDSQAEFDDLVAAASFATVLDGPWSKHEPTAGYEAASRFVVRRCDVLIALWDGQAQRGRGGTGPTLLAAAELGKPCIWIPTDEGEAGDDNLEPGTAAAFLSKVRGRVEGGIEAAPVRTRDGTGLPGETLAPLRESFRRLDEFNHAGVAPATLSARTDWPSWCRAPYLRAGALASKNKKHFDRLTWTMALLVTCAAAALSSGLTVWPEHLATAIAEIACLVALGLAFALVRWREFHQRWLSCRLLAERLRTARYIAPTGVDFRRSAEHETLFVEERSADWSVRAFEEIWDSRPQASTRAPRFSKEELTRIKHALADDWIDGQIAYHERAADRHEIHHRTLTILAGVLFLGTLLFPIFHAVGYENTVAVFCSITLPVAGAAVGAIRTVRQHHALAERFRRMRGDLHVVRTALLDAPTGGKLRQAASEAARTVAGEAGDWFGAMWFLDVDQPS